MAVQARLVYEAGSLEIDAGRRELRVGGIPVPLGGRAFEVIEVLVKSAGGLVTKDELMERVWPGVIVEENTLQVHISAIRKALGADRGMLNTVSGRGYRLSGNWATREAPAEMRARESASIPSHPFETNVPVAASALVGRELAVQHLRDLLTAYRVATLTGPGGIGKTVLAAEVARRLFPTIESDVFFVELVSLSDPALVPSAVVSTLGLQLGGDAISPESVARAIGGRKVLLVLDNCEHVVDAAARMAEALVRSCPHTTVLATSREVLRVEGEFVYRVPPLEVPAEHLEASDDVLEHSAVQLFVARTRSLRADFRPERERIPVIAEICRRLDGIPLAIEFAAAQAATLGVQHVAGHLGDRFALLTGGRRTALPRHRTLRAMLDWSYELLPEAERRLLRELAIFPTSFALEAAVAVVGESAANIALGISSLVSKSLLTLDGLSSVRRWRQLETTRAYALEKLAGSGQGGEAARRHAEYYRDLLERAEAQWEWLPMAELRASYGWQIDNVRAAIGWAFSPDGDALLGVALTTAAIPLWMQLSLLEEARSLAKRAIANLSAIPSQQIRLEMKLQAGLGASQSIIGGAVTEIEAAWARALHLAERLGDVDHQLRALFGLWLLKDRDCVATARQFLAVASTPIDRLLGEDMIAMSSHWLGDLVTPRHHFERVLAQDIVGETGRRVIHFQINRRSLARTFLARILWLMGCPEQAIHIAQRLIEDARAEDHPILLCHAAGYAGCPIALWVGDLRLAERYIDLLLDYATSHGLALWCAFGKAYRGMLLVRQGDLAGGLPLLREGFDSFGPAFAGYRVLMFLGELAEALGRSGRPAEGLATVDDALERAERSEELWVMPELLRVKGGLLRLGEASGAADAAEACFRKALQLAGTQAALAWELRAATSLATLYRSQSRPADAIACLRPVYARFTEGFGTADLIVAKQLLDSAPSSSSQV